ncbi:uncharacterized protein LOC136070608 [Quercus suber]|uniref:uncharacterized protein LOC136070608 n=1 Tax=Quercus suber TaxID=58331 RepID=UPI0032DE3678
MFNEIDGDFDDVAISTFKLGLPAEHGLRKSLIGKLVTSICQLMDRIDKCKKVEEDQQQDRGNGKPVAPKVVNTVFREPVHQVLEKIKNEPYFKWPNKMSGDPLRCNQSLHCQYHQEQGHAIEDYRTLWSHLEQLVKEGRLQHLLYHLNGQGDQLRPGTQGNASSRPLIGTINVIFATPGRTNSQPSRVMSVAQLLVEDTSFGLKRARLEIRPALSFLDEDKARTIQSHDDALVKTLRI